MRTVRLKAEIVNDSGVRKHYTIAPGVNKLTIINQEEDLSYSISFDGESFLCDCPAFQTRGDCKHLGVPKIMAQMLSLLSDQKKNSS